MDDTQKEGSSGDVTIAEAAFNPPQSTTISTEAQRPTIAQAPQPPAPAVSPTAPEESDSDDPSVSVPASTACKRRGCNVNSNADIKPTREGELCVYHPGHPIFHEGSKGWTCCKRRVLEFDEFMKIEGCKQKPKHLFTGTKKTQEQEERVTDVRYEVSPCWSYCN